MILQTFTKIIRPFSCFCTKIYILTTNKHFDIFVWDFFRWSISYIIVIIRVFYLLKLYFFHAIIIVIFISIQFFQIQFNFILFFLNFDSSGTCLIIINILVILLWHQISWRLFIVRRILCYNYFGIIIANITYLPITL